MGNDSAGVAVFAEPTGRRWRVVRSTGLAALAVLAALVAVQLAPVVRMVTAPLPGPSLDAVVDGLGATPVVFGSGPMLRIVAVHAGTLTDPFSSAELGPLTGADTAGLAGGTGVGYAVQRYGYGATPGAGAIQRRLVLTFDDGPDPVWTPKVLDVLAAAHVHATFFVTGRAAASYPDLIRRIVREGHALGNHSLSHRNLADLPPWRARLELEGNQRLVEALGGQRVAFVRPPYDGGTSGGVGQEVRAIAQAQQLGLQVASYDDDTHDWMYGGGSGDGTPIGDLPAAIALPELDGENRTVLMHDAGGDRQHTIDYLRDRLIPAARAAGYSFATVPEANPTLATTVGPATGTHSATTTAVQALVLAWLVLPNRLIDLLFLLAVAGVVLTGATFAGLALLRRRNRPAPPRRTPRNLAPPLSVSVLIAAYNEAAVIEGTLRSLAASRYPLRELIVVDDGSTDDTAAIVERLAGTLDPRIRLIRQPNGKKPSALNHGMRRTDSDVVVTVDADTHADPDMVANLVRHFEADPYRTLGAVAGVVRVGNRTENLLTRWQALEYVMQIGVERAAHDLMGAIAIVPGACAAWRREAVLRAGGFSHATLAEDADLTLTLHRAGWRITQDDEARADTEAPEDVDSLLKQRVRWTYGSLQSIVKHRDMVLRPRYGWLGMLVLPWGVLSLLVPLLTMPFVALMAAQAFGSQGIGVLGGYFVAFTLAQALTAAAGVWILREPFAHLLLVPVYRLAYDPLRAFLLYRTTYLAMRGVPVGWNKLRRTGSVTRQVLPEPAAGSSGSPAGGSPSPAAGSPSPVPSQRTAPAHRELSASGGPSSQVGHVGHLGTPGEAG